MATKISTFVIYILALIFSLACSSEKPSAYNVEPGWYTVTSEKEVPCYTKLKGHSGGTHIYKGNQHYVFGDADMFKDELYVKIKVRGDDYYAPLSKLKFYASEMEEKKEYIGKSPFEYTNPMSYLLVVIIVLMLAYLFVDLGSFVNLLIAIALPIILVAYLFYGPNNPLWMCHPSKVGWFVTIVSFFCILIFASILWGIVYESFKGIISIFNDFIYAIISLVLLPLNAYALLALIVQFIEEDLWAAIIFLLMLAPPTWVYVGSFTDSKGRKVDVYSK